MLFQPVLTGRSAGLDTLGQLFVKVLFRKCQAAVVDAFALIHFIPGGRVPQADQLVQGLAQVCRHLLHTLRLFRQTHTAADDLDLSVQIGMQIIQQIPAPAGLRRVRKIVRIHIVQTGLQPLFGVFMAAGTVVDLQNDLRHQLVRPAKSLGIHKRAETSVLLR